MTRRTLIAGNWKMYKTTAEAVAFVQALAPQISDSEPEVYLAVPFTAIHGASQAAERFPITVGAQNMNDATEGAFTGEIAGSMLVDAGAQFVLLGHSERRHLFNESSHFINKKVHRALEVGLEPIVCIGETLEQREQGRMEEILETMLRESLGAVSSEQMKKLAVAYEPVWAIGTGHTATPEQAEQTHHFIRQVIEDHWDASVSQRVSLLYGGSVKPGNASQLMAGTHVDGLLVGGASLEADGFAQIVNYQTLG